MLTGKHGKSFPQRPLGRAADKKKSGHVGHHQHSNRAREVEGYHKGAATISQIEDFGEDQSTNKGPGGKKIPTQQCNTGGRVGVTERKGGKEPKKKDWH